MNKSLSSEGWLVTVGGPEKGKDNIAAEFRTELCQLLLRRIG